MRKQYDDFIQMKQKDICKSISDMTFSYINPETKTPTKVPPAHYEKILDQIAENYIGDVTSRQFLTIMYNQLSALKKEDEKYFKHALLCMDMGINPKDLRLDEQMAIALTYDFMDDKQKQEKKNFHLLNQDIVNAYNISKENPKIQLQIFERSNRIEDMENGDYEI
ncbi:MAG: hypothetical protein J6C46_01955 [Clostridia bacterium]|nr:hypothetical protein [Clostridia bacterium]